MSRVTIYRGLEGEIIKTTDKAVLFKAINKQTGEVIKQAWFPKSQLSSFGGSYDEVDGTFNYILASEWILGQNGLLSAAVDPNLIKKDGMSPTISKPYTGATKQDKADRASVKDDEGQPAWDKVDDVNLSVDDYFSRYGNETLDDRYGD